MKKILAAMLALMIVTFAAGALAEKTREVKLEAVGLSIELPKSWEEEEGGPANGMAGILYSYAEKEGLPGLVVCRLGMDQDLSVEDLCEMLSESMPNAKVIEVAGVEGVQCINERNGMFQFAWPNADKTKLNVMMFAVIDEEHPQEFFEEILLSAKPL